MNDLFSAADFVTRDCCVRQAGAWGVWSILAQTADGVIALSYFLVPYELWRRSKIRVPDLLSLRLILLLFATFVVLCGLGHVCDVLVWYWPAYRLMTLIDCATAIASALTAVVLPVLVTALLVRNGGGTNG